MQTKRTKYILSLQKEKFFPINELNENYSHKTQIEDYVSIEMERYRTCSKA